MELIKLFMNLFMLIIFQMQCEVGKTFSLLHREVIGRPFDTMHLAVPSSLYILQDNLIIFALSCLDAGTYQVFQNRRQTSCFFFEIFYYFVGDLSVENTDDSSFRSLNTQKTIDK